jgi:site-specific DNA-methyltransferase (adenine-specific)
MLENYINQIIQGDCLKLLQQLPDESVDIVFADPPFNLKKKYRSHNDNLELQEYLDWCEEWIKECVRIIKPTGSIFLHNIPRWLTYYAATLNKISDFRHWITWDAPTAPMGKTLQPNHYGILFYAKDTLQNKFYEIRSPHKRCRKCGYLIKDYGGKKALLHPFGTLVTDVWTDIHRIRHNKYRDEHPCQLPIHLLERIILMSTDESEIVLDPFSGTGTTAIAAKRLGREFIGFELDSEYANASLNKLAQEQPNSKIDNCWVSFFLNEIVTLREKDWKEISKHYVIPNPIQQIDFAKIKFKKTNNFCFCPSNGKEFEHIASLPF